MIGRNIVLGEWECFNPGDAIIRLFSKQNRHALGLLRHNWNKCNGKCIDNSVSKSAHVLAPLVLEMWDRMLQAAVATQKSQA
jgi:hypothetical protein